MTIKKAIVRQLRSWLRSTTLPQGQITRAKIILGLHAGKTPTQVAGEQLVSAKTVHKWRNRFQADGVDRLVDELRTGRSLVLEEKVIKKVLILAEIGKLFGMGSDSGVTKAVTRLTQRMAEDERGRGVYNGLCQLE